jgi:guanylate kinase
MEGKLLIFSAPSGSGKTTIVHHLLNLNMGLEFSISATSREPRINEENGKDYFFLSSEDFRKKIDANEFLEWEEVYPNQYYGTLRSEVNKLRHSGKHVVFDIDVEGGVHLKEEFAELAFAVFVQAPSLEVMEQRLRLRGTDSEEQLTKRLQKAKIELSYAEKFDYILINNNLEESLKTAEQIVREFIRNS